MSLAVLRVPLAPTGPFERDRVAHMCGLLVREASGDVCWIYVAPHASDHPLFVGLERLLHRLRVGPRVALALAMKLTNRNLEPGAHHSQMRTLRSAGVEVTMCGEHHWRCEATYAFPPDARLLQFSGRINSWPRVVRTLLPHAEELHSLYSAMALLVCLGAAATAYSATQAKSAVGVLAVDWVLTVMGIAAAHAPVLALASATAILRPAWRAILALVWLAALILVNTGVASRFEVRATAPPPSVRARAPPPFVRVRGPAVCARA